MIQKDVDNSTNMTFLFIITVGPVVMRMMIIYRSLGKIRREKIFIRRHIRRKLNA